MNVNQLLAIFTPLPKQQKELLYDILLELVKLKDHEKRKEYLEMLHDFKEDLLYVDEEIEKIEESEKRIYVTQEELARIFNIPLKYVQTIINSNQLESYFDFDDFIRVVFNKKNK